MKTAVTKALIYDNTCPMCALYSGGFVKYGFLKEGNRIAFTELDQQEFLCRMDLQRSKHEIPLVDLENGETIYGLDALLFVLSQKWPLIGKIATKQPLYWFFKRLYAVVSYNRRIIIPSGKQAAKFDCTPDFNLKYRSAFIVFAVLFSSAISWAFGVSVADYLQISEGGYKMLLIAGTGWALQMLIAATLMKEKRMDYYGHLAVNMIIGVLILIPGIVLSALTHYQFIAIPLVRVGISSATMLWQHVKRVRCLGLSQVWTLLWFLSLQLTAAFWVMKFYFN